MVMTTGCVPDLGVRTISVAQVCPLHVCLCVCLSVCGYIVRYAWSAKMKNRLVSPPPPFSLRSFDKPSDKKPPPRCLQLPAPSQLGAPTLITSWGLAAGQGREGSRNGARGSAAAALRPEMGFSPLGHRAPSRLRSDSRS